MMMNFLFFAYAKRLYFLISLLFFSIMANSQVNNIGSNANSASSNVALDIQKIQISNDPFNGRVNVSAPLFNYDFGGIVFPISLYYASANGVKPDELPGWVGSGWQLITGGGYVHRTVRSRPDEVRDFETKIESTTTYPSGVAHTVVTKETNVNSADFSYFSNKSLLQNATWYMSTNAISGSFRGNTVSNGTNTFSPNPDYSLTTYNSNPFRDLASDEYTFSVGEVSGKFYLDHNNKWVVVSNDGKHYDIEVNVGEQPIKEYTSAFDPNFLFKYYTPRIIKNFIVTSLDGVQYIFGNEDLNAPFDLQYLEYSRSSIIATQTDFAPPPKVNGSISPTYLEMVPHTWHLTKIVNKRTGSQVLFSYSLLGPEMYESANAWCDLLWNNSSTSNVIYEATHLFLPTNINSTDIQSYTAKSKIWTRKWTLTDIDFSNGNHIKFFPSISSQLYSDVPGNYMGYEDIADILQNKLVQLDSIKISHHTEVLKQFNFYYQPSPSNRLQLQKVSSKHLGQEQTLDSFSYATNISLPTYGSRKTP